MHEKIFDILFKQDEISWKSIIYELVKSEQMDPWDIDVSVLSNKYIEMIKKMKEMDLRISGNVLLAAALLLKIKSTRLVGDDIDAFDKLMAGQSDDDLLDYGMDTIIKEAYERKELIPRTPQPRKRKVSIYDLINALQKALEVQKRRTINSTPIDVKIPEKKVDITAIIKDLYLQILNFFNKGSNRLTFSKLIPSEKKEDKVLTFIPLLHLTNQRKIDLYQQEHFGEIEIRLNKGNLDKSIEKAIV